MLKKVLYILLVLLLFYFTPTNAAIKIDKHKKSILNYSNNVNLESLIESGKLKLYLVNNSGVRLLDDKKTKKIYFEITGGNFEKKGDIYVYLNKEFTTLEYIIDLKTEKFVFDISDKLKLKRIQDRPLSCESSAAADIISYFKQRNINEYDIYNKMDKDFDNLPIKNGNYLLWGNPNKGFVGNINYYGEKGEKKPTQSGLTGYGVYEKPVKKVYDKYSIKTSIINKTNYSQLFGAKEHLTMILKNLEKGNMVQLWGDWCTRQEYEDGTLKSLDYTQIDANNGKSAKNKCWDVNSNRSIIWYYNENGKLKKHKGLAGEHAFYLLGYEGKINSPSKIIVWDTYTGYHKYDTIEWMRKWKAMDYRTIIAYKPQTEFLVYNN